MCHRIKKAEQQEKWLPCWWVFSQFFSVSPFPKCQKHFIISHSHLNLLGLWIRSEHFKNVYLIVYLPNTKRKLFFKQQHNIIHILPEHFSWYNNVIVRVAAHTVFVPIAALFLFYYRKYDCFEILFEIRRNKEFH